MSSLRSSNYQFRRVSYICIGCKIRRSVIVDEKQHLEREELKINGLASYIDVHPDLTSEDGTNHGVKLHIDQNFHVRSNDLLKPLTKPVQKKTMSGLPSPKVGIQSTKLTYPSESWNSLEMNSRQHNIGFYVINSDPTTVDEDNPAISMKSPLGTVTASINFRKSMMKKEELDNSKSWIAILLEWIESTASVNAKILPSVLRYIDKQSKKTPGIVDQLALPIIIDNSTQVRLLDEKKILGDIIGTTIRDPLSMGIFYPNQSVDYESFFLISEKMSEKKFVSIKQIIEIISIEATNIEKTLDTFVLFFFELVENDSIEYMVSYLL